MHLCVVVLRQPLSSSSPSSRTVQGVFLWSSQHHHRRPNITSPVPSLQHRLPPSPSMADLKAATNIDPNVWYHVTEGRVDDYKKPKFNAQLQITDKDAFMAVWAANVDHYWQFVSTTTTTVQAPRLALRLARH